MTASALVSSFAAAVIAMAVQPVPSTQPAQGPVLSRQALNAKAQELDDLAFLQGVHRVGAGVQAPKAATIVQPKYTAEAMRQKLQGMVIVEAVVGEDGSVIRARVKQSLDAVYGLDENAIAAARQWKFDPATIDPNASPVLVEFRLEFRLH